MAELFDPRPLLAVLADPRLEIVLIGGLAMVAHCIIRPTSDLYRCYAPSRETASGLAAALAPFHPRLRAEATEEGALLARTFRWDARTLRMGIAYQCAIYALNKPGLFLSHSWKD